MVPLVGLEPTHQRRGILNPLCLPISPQRQKNKERVKNSLFKQNYLETASFKAFPTLNLATVVAGTLTVLLVPGTLAVLAAL